MITPKLTALNRNEILQYLGDRGGAPSQELQTEIARCETRILETARPRLVYRQFSIAPDGTLSGTDFRPQGNDIAALLRQCQSVILMGATLGGEVEQLLRRAQISNMAEAVILDSCASCAIENVCDNFCDELQAQLSPQYLTDRFSPGYGDFPFSQQPNLCSVLDIGRRIGVSLSPSGLMIPQKSVTALIGVSDRPQKKRFRGCAYCASFEACIYRKEQRNCGKF